jgi:hypothetical protein
MCVAFRGATIEGEDLEAPAPFPTPDVSARGPSRFPVRESSVLRQELQVS